MDRQKSTAILEVVLEWAAGGRLKPRSVMEGGVVVADGCVIAPGTNFEIGIGFIGDLETLDVQSPEVGRIGPDDDFTDAADMPGKARRKKEIKFADFESVVNRLRQGKDQRIGVGPETQVDIAEGANF